MDCPHLGTGIRITRAWLVAQLQPPRPSTTTTVGRAQTNKSSSADAAAASSAGPSSSVATVPSNNQWQCSECKSTKENWICLHCGSILCGRYVNKHALKHSQLPASLDHCVCLNTLNRSVFCYSCDDFVLNDTVDHLLDAFRSAFPPDDCDDASHPQIHHTSSSEWALPPPSKPPVKSASTSSTSSSYSSQGTRSTLSTDSGLGVDESLPSAVGAGTRSTPPLTIGGRKLRPRKRTISGETPDAAVAKRKTTRKVVGLRNLGNTCFMNSVLQSLSNIQEFSCYFNALPSLDPTVNGSGKQQKRVYQSRSLKENCKTDANVVEELRKILTNLSHGGDGSKAISPECLFLVIWKVVPQFRGHRQHDAHEFLRYMLDRLHTELQNVPPMDATSAGGVAAGGLSGKAAGNSTAITGGSCNKLQLGPVTSGLDGSSIMFKGRSSIVTSVFGGTLQSEVRCLICGMESKKHDPFLDLSLDIPEKFCNKEGANGDSGNNKEPSCHIADCLSSFTEIEELAETELYYCSGCKCKQKSTKRFWIRRLPNVLCLHIKRFRWNNFFRTKIDLRISFPITSMDMSQFVLNNGPETRRSTSATNVYDLAAVIVHHGNGSSYGHYTSYAVNNGTWLHFNDHTVKEVQLSAVEECKPYILFYIRKDLNGSKS